MEEIKFIELKDWLAIHIRLLEEDKMAAFMQCCCHKLKFNNEVILCNVDSIPKGYTVNDIIDITEGKHIHL